MSTKFLDGPAVAATGLCLRFSPPFLRVVQNDNGEWDGLDQAADRPEHGEMVYAYQLVKCNGAAHICGTRKGKRFGGYVSFGEYRYVEPQPPQETLFYNSRWWKWVEEQEAKQREAKHANQ